MITSLSASVRVPAVALAIGCVGVLVAADEVDAQSVVQLPSFHTFSYSGTVVVPDSGAGYLGGRNSAASGSRSRGASHAIGAQAGAAQASVHATIIDLEAMDREILANGEKRLSQPGRANGTRGVTREATLATQTEEGKQLVRYAREQLRLGNTGSAFDAYKMAVTILPSGLRELAAAEFRRAFPVAGVQGVPLR